MSTPSNTTVTYLRIGQLAERSGVSAKALRLYEQRGLLNPCAHSVAGYRLYGPDALQRLMQIVVLKRSGFRLGEIGRLFERDARVAANLIAARIDTIERELADRAQALENLRRMAWYMGSASTLDLDQLLESIHMGNSLRFDLTHAERQLVRRRAERIGSDHMKALHGGYPELLEQMRTAMQSGTPATDVSVASIIRRYRALAPVIPDLDAAVKEKMISAIGANPNVMAKVGLDPALFRYLCDAVAAAKASTDRPAP